MSDETTREFNYEMRKTVPEGFRDLLEAATEIHRKCGLHRGEEHYSRRRIQVTHGPEWERLRAALMDLARNGFVAEEWQLEERF